MNAIREVHLPEELCAAAEKKFAGRFQTVEELLIFALRELVNEQASALDKTEQLVLERRLRDLGYL
jgi:hypothetical protein